MLTSSGEGTVLATASGHKGPRRVRDTETQRSRHQREGRAWLRAAALPAAEGDPNSLTSEHRKDSLFGESFGRVVPSNGEKASSKRLIYDNIIRFD